ncbi:hypothetical protein Ais01nite_28540 [Asanoa ishikariensis]|nr:hypothetical protein Ais01nite_28540 [Asanoa ishikariensis]
MCQISKRLPLALVVGDDLAGVIRRSHPRVAVVVISDPDVDELRGSTDVLRRTLLPYGWTDEFDPEAFSALDLFLETT